MNTLELDNRFKTGTDYVNSTLQAYQRDRTSNASATFPTDFKVDEIGVTIDERSIEYMIGDTSSVNPYATQGTIRTFKDEVSTFEKMIVFGKQTG